MSLAMDARGRVRRGRLDEAENLSGAFVDPVTQIPHVVLALGLEVGEVRRGDVVHRDGAVQLVNIEEEWHLGLLSSGDLDASTLVSRVVSDFLVRI